MQSVFSIASLNSYYFVNTTAIKAKASKTQIQATYNCVIQMFKRIDIFSTVTISTTTYSRFTTETGNLTAIFFLTSFLACKEFAFDWTSNNAIFELYVCSPEFVVVPGWEVTPNPKEKMENKVYDQMNIELAIEQFCIFGLDGIIKISFLTFNINIMGQG